MNEHPNTAIIQSAYETVEKGEVAAYAALLDDDIISLGDLGAGLGNAGK
jgi:hypothetical protein